MSGVLAGFVYSCPKFVAMEQTERRSICYKANICLSCLSTKVTHSTAHLTDCQKKKDMKNGIKDEYCCMAPRCSASIWTCVYHKRDPVNAANIQKRRDQMNLMGWTMGM